MTIDLEEIIGPEKKLVIFDFDGTLVDLGIDWYKVRGEMREFLRDKYGMEFEFSSAERSSQDAIREIGWVVEHELNKIREGYEFSAVSRAKPLPCLKIAKIISEERRSSILSSNFTETIKRVLKRFDSEHFSPVLGRDMLDAVKPDPSGVRKSLKITGISHEAAVLVGDRDVDRKTALEAGIDFLHVDELC